MYMTWSLSIVTITSRPRRWCLWNFDIKKFGCRWYESLNENYQNIGWIDKQILDKFDKDNISSQEKSWIACATTWVFMDHMQTHVPHELYSIRYCQLSRQRRYILNTNDVYCKAIVRLDTSNILTTMGCNITHDIQQYSRCTSDSYSAKFTSEYIFVFRETTISWKSYKRTWIAGSK